jgi:cytochrome b6-f complex iron-sulfur subunit
MAPQNVDFTLDLSNASYAALKTNGGYIYQDNIIIVRTSTGEIVALSDICTHTGCTVNFSNSSNDFLCPCHGSVFAIDGSVVRGPAPSPLKRYNTTINGNSLRIYS